MAARGSSKFFRYLLTGLALRSPYTRSEYRNLISGEFTPRVRRLESCLVFSREFLRVQYKKQQAVVKENQDDEGDVDVDYDFDEVITVTSTQRRQAERLWGEILPLNILNVGPVVKMWVADDKHIGLPGVLYVIGKLRTFKRFKQALSILDWLAEDEKLGKLNEHLCRLHVWIACEAHEMEKAEEIFLRTPPEFQTDRLKAALAVGYACRNRSDKAEEMIDKYKLRTVEPYTALLKLYFRIGVQDKVTSLYKQMKELSIQPNLAAFATLLRQREPSGNVEEIKQDAEEALRTAGAFDEELKLRGSVASYAMVILAYLGKEQETVRMWKHIQEQESISADSYIDAIDAFGALGKVRLAEKVADEMEMTKQSYTRLSAAMIHLYSRCKMMDKAESVMDDLRENGVWTVFRPYSELILGYLDNNQPDRAMLALKKALLVKVVKPSYTVMLKMLPVFERQRDAEGAEDMVNRYRGVTDLRLYKGLLKVYVSSRVKPIEEIEARLILKKIKPDEETIHLLNKLKKIIG